MLAASLAGILAWAANAAYLDNFFLAETLSHDSSRCVCFVFVLLLFVLAG
jgi:hypothetical protein